MFRSVLVCIIGLSLSANVFAVGQAANPDPANGATGVLINKVLRWTPGVDAVSHDVYFGTTFNDVNNASRVVGDLDGDGVVDSNDLLTMAEYWLQDPAGSEPFAGTNGDAVVDYVDFGLLSPNWSKSSVSVFKGNQDSNSFSFDPSLLTPNTTYYWRVDEVNSSTIVKGEVGSFTTQTGTVVYADQVSPYWNATDVTTCLTNAITNSTSGSIIIVRNMGSPWEVGKIQLWNTSNNKTLILQTGAIIEAKSGSFTGTGDNLFRLVNTDNFTFSGAGPSLSKLKMRKSDYQNPPYTASANRMGINVSGCINITIEGITIEQTGGDGIYIASSGDGISYPIVHTKNVTITNVVCDNNLRQGMSVIDANGLTVTSCEFNNTSGAAPQAGVDIEPNTGTNIVKNLVFKNCKFIDNAGGGFALALYHYRKGLPMSGQPQVTPPDLNVTLENCFVSGSGITEDPPGSGWFYGGAYMIGSLWNDGPANMTVLYKNCVATDCDGAGLHIWDVKSSGTTITADGCTFGPDLAKTQLHSYYLIDTNPIALVHRANATQVAAFGGVNFINSTKVIDNKNRSALKVVRTSGIPLNNVTGILYIQNPLLVFPTQKIDFGSGTNNNVTLTGVMIP